MPLLIALAIGSAIWNAPRLIVMYFERHPYDGSGREPRR